MSTYNPTLWVDYETPVNAGNLNKSEAGIQQQSTDISVLSEYVSALDNNLNNDIGALSSYVAELDTRVTDDVSSLSEFVTVLDDKVDVIEKKKEIFVGNTKPDKEDVLWVDTNQNTIDSSLDSLILDEFRNLISRLTLKVNTLELEVAKLNEIIGQGGGGGSEVSNDTILTFEDDSIIVFEDGSTMILSSDSQLTNDTILTFEDDSTIIFEDGSTMILSANSTMTNDTILIFEDSSTIISEDGSTFIL